MPSNYFGHDRTDKAATEYDGADKKWRGGRRVTGFLQKRTPDKDIWIWYILEDKGGGQGDEKGRHRRCPAGGRHNNVLCSVLSFPVPESCLR